MYNWESLKVFFQELNRTEYVVLRNFEEYNEKLLNEAHPDIDILCLNRNEIIALTKSISRTKNNKDAIHRKVLIDNTEVEIDIRCVGDGYYDTRWEKEILMHRKLWNDMFYVPNEEDYFYSLLYHALVHKNTLDFDYKNKLEEMASKLFDYKCSIGVKTLEEYMKSKRYRYTYPESAGTIFNKKNIDRQMIKKNIKRQLARLRRKIEGIIRI